MKKSETCTDDQLLKHIQSLLALSYFSFLPSGYEEEHYCPEEYCLTTDPLLPPRYSGPRCDEYLFLFSNKFAFWVWLPGGARCNLFDAQVAFSLHQHEILEAGSPTGLGKRDGC